LNLIRASLERPVAVVAAVIMVILFGVVALQQIPIQLAPDVRKPTLTVETLWPGAAPADVEREIVTRQEEALKGIEGVESIEGRAETGRAQVTLQFRVSQNMDRAILLVSNRLDQVTDYPDEVKRPQIKTRGTEDNAIAYFTITKLPGSKSKRPIYTYGDFIEDQVVERIERIPGVGGTRFFGGSNRELRIIVEPSAMARYGLTVPNVVSALQRANVALSAGDVNEGKRRYVVRFSGDLTAVRAVRNVLVRTIEDKASGRIARVRIADIARVAFGYKEPVASLRASGDPAMVVAVMRDTGANVMTVMKDVRARVAELNAQVLKPAGLVMTQVYDETDYINSAIDLVTQNIWVGGLFAATILLLFLRSWRATLVVSLAIPVSVIGSFVAMAALGRSINVISLAGIAFAVGMVVDAAIVVLENIYRFKEQGKPIFQAAYEGTKQVWGAVLVSALTTVMVFIPILTMDLEVGQLFRDIAVAISVSVLLSLVVAVTLIPALANWLLGGRRGDAAGDAHRRLRLPGLDHLAMAFRTVVLGFTGVVIRSRVLAVLVVAAVCGGGALVTWQLLPKLEYLPTGNRNLVLALSLPPPGYNLDTVTGIAHRVEAQLRRYLPDPDAPKQAKKRDFFSDLMISLGFKSEHVDDKGPLTISRYFFVARNALTIVAAAATNPTRASELIPIIQRAVGEEPGTFARVFQPSLFGRSIGGGRVINFDVSGSDLRNNLAVAQRAFLLIRKYMPPQQGTQIRPRPGLTLGAPELKVVPNRVRLDEAAVSARDLAMTIDAFNDGMRVAQVTVGDKRIDLTLMGPENAIKRTQGIENIPVVTPSGKILPVRSLAKVQVTRGATEIRHLERLRTVTLQVAPSKALPLEAAMDILRDKVIPELRKAGLPPGVKLTLSGEADQLTKTWHAMVWQLIFAIIIVYLVMAVLFESFVYPFIIIFSVPLATAGGILGLALLNNWVYQPLDMLTLLGFVILIGTVVNNAILLVDQTLYHVRTEGMSAADGILEATRNRLRPIFMSTLTSVFGMAPLVLFPGAGSELYRGLGSVVLGGLALSAVLTLLIIPPLLSLVVRDKPRQALASSPPLRSAPAPGE
jgi:HAE1 family hydrophobic/amphiphilic exporter-1